MATKKTAKKVTKKTATKKPDYSWKTEKERQEARARYLKEKRRG